MKDKLRELAERWNNFGGSDYSGDQAEGRRIQAMRCAFELKQILDAEGEGGAVSGWQERNARRIELGYGGVTPTALTHPARSGVVRDEDVIEACEHYDVNYEEGSRAEFIGMRAALEHFAKGERHER